MMCVIVMVNHSPPPSPLTIFIFIKRDTIERGEWKGLSSNRFAGIINRAGVERYIRGFKKFVIEKVG